MRLEQKIAKQLTAQGLTLSVAESCTGGLLSHTLTNVPGSSAFFKGGIVAYSNAVKTSLLGVPKALIFKHGAVSAPVAKAMAQGSRKALRTAIGIGITGIAGPDGGSKLKPVGLVFIAISDSRTTSVHEHHFRGTRSQIKAKSMQAALRICAQKLA